MTVSPEVRSDRHPLTADGSVELAVLERSGFDESRHVGAGVVVDASGTVIDSVGDVTASIYPRSTMKPFQALAVRRAGALFSDEELVLTTASHAGTAAHQALALHMLESFDHVEADLGCPPDMPFDRGTARTMDGPRRLAMNCSGKHAGMLAACRVNGWDEATYLDIEHPLQQRVRAVVEEYTHETVDLVGTDGCGAPVFPLTLTGLARGFAGVVARADDDSAALTDAVLAHPWAIDGVGRANTVTIERLQVLAKLGAEGVMVMGLPGGAAVAVKVLDGSQRAGTLAALALLERNGLVASDGVAEVLEATGERVLGGGMPVGAVRVGAGLR
ncbi:asparaginase [Curtobacterium flaccumfaciens]|uniref:asparaginase n=1 Tax=Curtobacterium flaccumfaciens TaxID=2035 RepID=UPI000FFE3A95|nr:asparaginase [Curtobacterium flaccumfaciens]MCS0644628.1 asparaginase [Curtobacterium flaccumfaciens pv. flaccumfaciens]MCS6527680.1 asparaginase [Curtobacterium flaccumfaciens pv. flaccumfaciens]MCS6528012.1 asparaginase [Curtobacterium flaccumfaciens pv. flaccumfaciens]NUU09265.1 asparaginase [Curtobacterium flaccumfaciens]RXF85898.1 asparaginase [Curtobacterium flaccumfaciens pv. flaccumfaciens]